MLLEGSSESNVSVNNDEASPHPRRCHFKNSFIVSHLDYRLVLTHFIHISKLSEKANMVQMNPGYRQKTSFIPNILTVNREVSPQSVLLSSLVFPISAFCFLACSFHSFGHSHCSRQCYLWSQQTAAPPKKKKRRKRKYF